MRLCIDIGNSRIKWGWSTAPGDISEAGVSHRLADLLAALPMRRPDEVLVADVRGDDIASLLGHALAERGWPAPRLLRTPAEFGGLRIGYRQPEAMGVDRFLGLLACLDARPGVVLSAGTALTVDGVDVQGVHQGGLILPGARATLQALTDAAPSLSGSGDLDQAVLDPWATDTAQAVSNGLLYAWAGGAQRAVADMRFRLGEDCRVVVTGGDGRLLHRWLQINAQYDELLVLRGMTYV